MIGLVCGAPPPLDNRERDVYGKCCHSFTHLYIHSTFLPCSQHREVSRCFSMSIHSAPKLADGLAIPAILVVMGTSGTGKSTIGAYLTKALPQPSEFIEGDELHPPENIIKMSSGTPLTDEDRIPWLEAVRTEAVSRLGRDTAPPRHVVVACSALKRSYRRILTAHVPYEMGYIFLTGPTEVLLERMKGRKGHFMPVHLLSSQLSALEAPTRDELGKGAFLTQVNVGGPDLPTPDKVVQSICLTLVHHAEGKEENDHH